MVQMWEILYTTDCGKTFRSLEVPAISLTDAILQGAKDIPSSCFDGADDTSAIVSVKLCK